MAYLCIRDVNRKSELERSRIIRFPRIGCGKIAPIRRRVNRVTVVGRIKHARQTCIRQQTLNLASTKLRGIEQPISNGNTIEVCCKGPVWQDRCINPDTKAPGLFPFEFGGTPPSKIDASSPAPT